MLMHADKKRARGGGGAGRGNRQRRSYLFQSDIDFAWANIARWSELNILSAQMRCGGGLVVAHGSGCCHVRALIHTTPPSHTCQPPCQVIMSSLHCIARHLSSQLAPRVPPQWALTYNDYFHALGLRLRSFHISLGATYSASEWMMHCSPPA